MVIAVLFFFYGMLNSKITYAGCTYKQHNSQECCGWGTEPCKDCDKEGNCWVGSCQVLICGDCSYDVTYNEPDWTNCDPGDGGDGECISGSCRDCDYNSGNYCINGADHYGSHVCNSWYQASNKCCGDDASEAYRTSTGQGSDGTTACCPSSVYCVLAGTCYNVAESTCIGNLRTTCTLGGLTQTTCTYGCSAGECIPGPQVTNIVINPTTANIGQDISITWQDPTGITYGIQ